MTGGRADGSRVRTVFVGSGQFAVPILEALRTSPQVQLVGVISAPDRPAGRRGEPAAVPVAHRARELGLPLLQPERIRAQAAVDAIAALGPVVGVLADYGQIVPGAVLDIPERGFLNIHPSILPRHRGASPIPATISSGDREAGVTLIRMDEGLDSGPIVAQESWAMTGAETTPELEAEAARRGAALLQRSMDAWLSGAIHATPQPVAGVTLTRPLRREDGRLDPNRSAVELERQVRANLPWPGSFVETEVGRLIVHAAAVADSEPSDEPGHVVADGDGLAVTTRDGRLRLLEVQLAGRRATDAAALRRGAPGLVGRPIALR